MPIELDPYGEEFGDWVDPYLHADDMCTGCDMCAPWEGLRYEDIRAERRAVVRRRRAAADDARAV